jgi:putative transposase
MKNSMSRKADCWDNAPTEGQCGSLKRACVYGRRFRTRAEATEVVMNWLAFYKAKRVHSILGYVSPMKFEKNWRAEQERRSA